MEFTNLITQLDLIGKNVKEEYKDKIKKGAFATGKLYNSVNYRLDITEKGVKLTFLATDYWIDIENGRKAGGKMPNVKVIQKWIVTKGIPDKPGLDYMISRAIQRDGIKPKPYLRDIKIKLKDYNDDIKKALNLDLEHDLTKIKDKFKQIKK